ERAAHLVEMVEDFQHAPRGLDRSVRHLRPPALTMSRASRVSPYSHPGSSGAFFETRLPGRGLAAEVAPRTLVEPVAELHRHLPEGRVEAHLVGSIHRPVRIVEDLAAHTDEIGL